MVLKERRCWAAQHTFGEEAVLRDGGQGSRRVRPRTEGTISANP